MNCCTGKMRETKETYRAKWGDYKVAINGVKAYRCDTCQRIAFDEEEVNTLLNLIVLLSSLSEEKRPSVIDIEKYREQGLL